MAITPANIHLNLSGGAGNADPNTSFGGVMSVNEIVDATLENLFRDITGDESTAGITLYRCYYIENKHATLVAQNAKLWIESQTSSDDTALAMGLAPEGLGGTAELVADEETAPVTVTFTAPSSSPTSLAIGDIAVDNFIAVWLRLTVNAGSLVDDLDQTTIRTTVDTSA